MEDKPKYENMGVVPAKAEGDTIFGEEFVEKETTVVDFNKWNPPTLNNHVLETTRQVEIEIGDATSVVNMLTDVAASGLFDGFMPGPTAKVGEHTLKAVSRKLSLPHDFAARSDETSVEALRKQLTEELAALKVNNLLYLYDFSIRKVPQAWSSGTFIAGRMANEVIVRLAILPKEKVEG